MQKAYKLVVFHPWIVIAAVCAITAAFGAIIFVKGVKFDGSPETLARRDVALSFFNQTRSIFGDDHVIIAALSTDDVFTAQFLTKLDRLTTRLGSVAGVSEVQSLTNIKAIRRLPDGVKIDLLIPRPLLYTSISDEVDQQPGTSNLQAAGHATGLPRQSEPEQALQLTEIKTATTSDPLYAKQFVSEDGRTAAINIFLGTLDEENMRRVAKEVEQVARSEAAGDELLLAGVPIIDSRAIDHMFRDILVCSPIAVLLCFIAFAVSFRSLTAALLPMAGLIFGVIWTVGAMCLFDRPITFTTLPLPTSLMAIGSSYFFHVLNQHQVSTLPRGDADGKRAAWLKGLTFISPAVIVSATTTMAGFGALASSAVPTVRDMGIFLAFGALAMLIIGLTLLPAILSVRPRLSNRRVGTQQEDYAPWMNGLLRQVTAWILYRRNHVLALSLLGTLLIGAGALWLRVNTDYLRIFPESSETVRAALGLHEKLAGAASLQLVVSAGPDAVTEPPFLQGLARLEAFAAAQPGVDASVSIAGIVRKLSPSEHRPDDVEGIPGDRQILRSIFDDYLAQEEGLSRLVSPDRSRALIILRTNLYGSQELRKLIDRVEGWAQTNLPAGASAKATGSIVLLNSASDDIADSQVSSLAIALLLIYLMMAMLFRSPATGLLALAPNLLPIVCFFGFLGWLGIALDMTTTLVASGALGLAVDNAVHMIRRYRQSLEERGGQTEADLGWAMWLTILRTGKPMLLANIMLIVAYLIFVLSSFIPVRTSGWLWALTIFACLLSNLIFLPALMRTEAFRKVALGRPTDGRYTGIGIHRSQKAAE